ncbi:hypothetical protein F5144DRAFT_596104 [Chaetomium tenue]|uniref:Uncharacterized protein n=1 Tax=Chaetomium tenue TaxID=1854479 RepID=A0ACB7NW86_9PEZI|nr:hypothetical protein F5144DRAFT_596104 [Chaetomium globosum]
MPCFKGIAVSIHANGMPLPEHGVQKQSRVSRINSYIPVPQPQLSGDSNKPEPAKFAISITLLTPGLTIPYSACKPTPDNPNPKPQLVGPLPSSTGERGKFHGVVTPYIPMTNSENETIAAYIYFDGRGKEEVATLLRPGEETWVNSRWVQVPDAEGGGLAEREFLFREVGLERWLNGLDLKGHDAAEKLERRRQRFERRRRRQKLQSEEGMGMDFEGSSKPRGTLRYGADERSPVEAVFDEDSISSSDDDEPPEATGQIKVAMFRVIASGEIKKGEYSPQFDAHDDSSEDEGKGGSNGIDADVEHTTSFAKPKTLDPKTISTQTVTGIDGPDKPYAVFTFFYRGERQLQKMGVMAPPKPQTTSPAMKRRSGQVDFSSLGPLKTSGTVGFSAFRDRDSQPTRSRKSRKSNGASESTAMDADSDDDDDDDDSAEILSKMEDIDSKDDKSKLRPDDAQFSGELADGVNRIRLKRAHSADPDSASSPRKSPSAGIATPPEAATPGGLAPLGGAAGIFGKSLTDDSNVVGSPLKKARPSLGADAILPPRARRYTRQGSGCSGKPESRAGCAADENGGGGAVTWEAWGSYLCAAYLHGLAVCPRAIGRSRAKGITGSMICEGKQQATWLQPKIEIPSRPSRPATLAAQGREAARKSRQARPGELPIYPAIPRSPIFRDQSMLTFQSAQSAGVAAILDKLTNLPFQKVVHDCRTLEAQPAPNDGIIILVTGQLKVDDGDHPLPYSQAFQLCRDPAGQWFVFNDVFTLALG